MKPNMKFWYFSATLTATLLLTTSLAGQSREAMRERLKAQKSDKFQRPDDTQLFEAAPLEHPIDPETYIVGAGDKFSIVIEDIENGIATTIVTADGNLIVPMVGTFAVAGRKLAAVQQEITALGRTKFLQNKVSVHLLDLRYFRVHVLGEVYQPGLYDARPNNRISDVIQFAGDINAWGNQDEILLQRGESKTTIALSRYSQEGDLSQNPNVHEGDVIIVPRISSKAIVIKVEGRIRKSGYYHAKQNETAAAFLKRVPGIGRKADILSAVIRRPVNTDRNEFKLIPVSAGEAETNGHSSTSTENNLRSGDIISIPSVRDSVYVKGAARIPGPYPYFPGFLARDYAGLAGATERASSFEMIKTHHTQSNKVSKGPNVAVLPGDTVELLPSRRTVYREIIQTASIIVSTVFSFVLLREALRD